MATEADGALPVATEAVGALTVATVEDGGEVGLPIRKDVGEVLSGVARPSGVGSSITTSEEIGVGRQPASTLPLVMKLRFLILTCQFNHRTCFFSLQLATLGVAGEEEEEEGVSTGVRVGSTVRCSKTPGLAFSATQVTITKCPIA